MANTHGSPSASAHHVTCSLQPEHTVHSLATKNLFGKSPLGALTLSHDWEGGPVQHRKAARQPQQLRLCSCLGVFSVRVKGEAVCCLANRLRWLFLHAQSMDIRKTHHSSHDPSSMELNWWGLQVHNLYIC